MVDKITIYQWTETQRVRCLACEDPYSATVFGRLCRRGLWRWLFCKLRILLPVEHFHSKCPRCGFTMITCKRFDADTTASKESNEFESLAFVDKT